MTNKLNPTMKNILVLVSLVLFTCLFSTKTFAQREAGGTSAGSGTHQPCPDYFKRNNGNGTCGGDAQIRVYFSQQVTSAPVLTAVWYQGEQITGIALPVYGDMSELSKKGYISYCIEGRNIPPAIKITLQFQYQNGQEDCLVSE